MHIVRVAFVVVGGGNCLFVDGHCVIGGKIYFCSIIEPNRICNNYR
ncbi:hypothetical protein D6I95_08095 [Alcaligenes faecalis]|nr:hypothetical protein D6I95_08095 [Alcaligenes faecalis]